MIEIRTEQVDIPVAGAGVMTAHLALPSGAGPFPAVLVFQEIFGINRHIRDITERIAREGYAAIAPDYHHRAWPRGTEYAYDEQGMKRGMEVIPKLSADGLNADLDATIALLHTRKEILADRLGAIGFCIGGHVAYYAAATRPIAATASFYGGGIASFSPPGDNNGAPTVSRTGGIKGRILCLFGKQDSMIPPAHVDTIASALKEHHVRHEIVVYQDAGHAFFRDPDPNKYKAKDAADAWERVRKLFAEELRK